MAYIGREPQVGNFQVCDAISVVNNQAAYTMQVSSVNVSPETENHMLVSLNGILQRPGSSFTVSGSTITFASNLVTGDVINFIHILGSVLDLGVPSDSTVSLAKLTATGTKNSTTFLRGDNTFAEAGGGAFEQIATADYSSAVSTFTLTDCFTSAYSIYKVYFYNILFASDNSELRVYFQNASNADVDGWVNYGVQARLRDDGGDAGLASEGGGISDYLRLGIPDFESATNEVSALEMTIYQPFETAQTLASYNVMLRADDGNFYSTYGSARLNVTTPLHNLSFRSSNGTNFSSYKTVIYGVKRS